MSTRDFAAFMVCALAVFFIGVLAGVIAGVTIALLLLIVSASKSPTRQIGYDRAHDVYVHVDTHAEAELVPGVMLVGIDGPLFFADADNYFRTSVLQLVKSHQPHVVILDLTATNMIDMDGERTLGQLTRELRGKHIKVLLVRVGTDSISCCERRARSTRSVPRTATGRCMKPSDGCPNIGADPAGLTPPR